MNYVVEFSNGLHLWAEEIPKILLSPGVQTALTRQGLVKHTQSHSWNWRLVDNYNLEERELVAEGYGPMALLRAVNAVQPHNIGSIGNRIDVKIKDGPHLYVASSWKNTRYEALTQQLREFGYGVCDWRSPDGFSWDLIDPNWANWNATDYLQAMDNIVAQNAALRDFQMMNKADACILLLPSGRSSHIEAGWFIGAGKPVLVLLEESDIQADLMYQLAQYVVNDIEGLRIALTDLIPTRHFRRGL